MIDAASLAEANIVYRHPNLYDELTHADDQADTVARVVADLGARVATVLDLGCGTGRDLGIFRNRCGWSGVGIDLQPQMIDYARTTRPDLDLRVGDLRDLRLHARFDLITCLGNSLAYLHTDRELAAVAETASEHAHPGALLIINTLTTPPPEASDSSHRVHTADGDATVTINSRWHPDTRLHTTSRAWDFDHGGSALDRLVRRVIARDELDAILAGAHFETVRGHESPFAVYQAPDRRL
ncbi:class I SAM-dependent methyltransferase [Pseudonocardia acaciae]|uniref:class I SAM-dependent methyltransferase n=1 Tax=Pseudonocardia acaciae TaxID=551276 RepID=UPI000685A224|nr:class I SAM-dependent methyltransferase [Pseudonocardia acaciae]